MITAATVPDDGVIRLGNGTENDASILVTGDLCPVADVEGNFLAGKGEFVYGDLLGELRDKDLSITNLELALTCGGTAIDKCGPNLRANPDIFPAMAAAEFDVYGVANNHSRDWGDDAFLETLEHIETAGCAYVGGGKNAADAAKPLFVDVKGRKFAIIAITMHCDCDAGETTPGANALNLPYNVLTIQAAKQQADHVIVIFHDGKEHVSFPSKRIRNYCRAFVDAGACAVIGHHPHISRGFEFYKGSLIAYSLGNFMFPTRRDVRADPPSFWFEGYALRLHVGPNGLTGVDVIPHCYSAEEQHLQRMPEPRHSAFLARLNRLNDILSRPGENERYFSASAATYSYYYTTIQRYCEDMLKGCEDEARRATGGKLMNHYLNCDEHWDVLDAVSLRQWHGVTDMPGDLDDFKE